MVQQEPRATEDVVQRLRETEDRFRVMADAAPVMLWMSALDSNCYFFNQPWLDFTGRTLEQEVGTGWVEGVHFEDFQHCLDTYLGHFNARKPFRMRYRLRRHDGKYRWILDTGVPRYSPDGTFMGFIGSCIDIQEMVEAHEALENLNAALEKANLELAQRNEELDSFAHIASHDLKEPIRGIAHLLNFLREDCGPQLGPAGHGLLDRMDAVVERMQRLLDALLDYASVGRAEAEAQRVDLSAVVDRALEPLQPRILEWGVEVRIPRPLPTVRCAPIRAEQVFANLLSNALKYGPEQGAVIEIGWAESDPSASEARIPGGPVLYVRDNGIGIPENQHENIFRVFKRLHPRDSYGGGAGVGLSIVRKIVDVSGGHLRVESAPGHGATFWFTFGGQTS